MPGSTIVFLILAAIAVVTALGTILSRNAIYSALFLVLNFATVAVLYLILGAPFIALSQITVYAGSIMVLFLFVIMLLGAERLPEGEALRWQPLAAIPLGIVLVIVLVVNLTRGMASVPVASVPADYGAPNAVGQLLFTQYALPFEVTAIILLVAVVGAIMLAKPDRTSPRSKAGRYIQANPSFPAPTGERSVTGMETTSSVQEEATANAAAKAETAEAKSAGEK